MAEKKKKLKLPEYPSVAEQLKRTAAQPEPAVQPKPNPTPEINRVFTDVKTGQPSGFEVGGKTYFGATPQEITQTEQNLQARAEPIKQLQAINLQRQQEIAQQQLVQQQTGELEQFRGETAPQPADTITERNVRAGIAVYDALFSTLGLIDESQAKSKGVNVSKIDPISKGIFTAVGKAATLGYGRVRISTLIDTSGNIRNLQSDAGEAVRFSNAQLALALTRSETRPKANTDDAIANAQIAEEAIRIAYSQAQSSLKLSPGDIADGLDLTDAMRTDLGIAIQNRQMLERYRITQDPTEIQTALAGQYDIP